jgi:putative ABC transport system substrate-binding protein
MNSSDLSDRPSLAKTLAIRIILVAMVAIVVQLVAVIVINNFDYETLYLDHINSEPMALLKGVGVGPKRLELIHELVPTATVIALLVNPTSTVSETLAKELLPAARTLGLQLHVLHAGTGRDLDAVFEGLTLRQAGPLVIGVDAFFIARSKRIAALALRHAIPAIFQNREFAAAGGLMSYGSSGAEAFRQVGLYAGRILKGERAADMPVQQATKVELVINLKTAKALGLTVPPTLLARADEVIE